MMLKSLKFWHNWFQRKPAQSDVADTEQAVVVERKHPSAVMVRAALRQKQKITKAAAQ